MTLTIIMLIIIITVIKIIILKKQLSKKKKQAARNGKLNFLDVIASTKNKRIDEMKVELKKPITEDQEPLESKQKKTEKYFEK